MAEQEQELELQAEQPQDELSTLKARAAQLGISHNANIGVAKLKAKIDTVLNETVPEEEAEEEIEQEDEVAEAKPKVVKLTPAQARAEKIQARKKEASKLIRVQVTCMNPNKKDWEGEIISAGSARVGTFTKFVPFNATDGWHLPKILVDMLKAKQFISRSTEKQGNREVNITKLMPEYAINFLPPLTPAELKALAQRQAMAKGSDN